VAAAAGLLIACGCVPYDTYSAPPIDWDQANYLANMTFDVTHKDEVTDDQLRERYGTPGGQVTVLHLSNDDRYMIVMDPVNQRQTIAAAGTDTHNIQDILVDLDFQMDYDAQLDIHLDNGFRDYALLLREAALPILDPNYTTTVTGYSLGGAIAVILSMYLTAVDGFTVDRIVTFGQPMVTDSEGADVFGRLPLWRFKAARDVVPDLPPPEAYHHFGKEVILLDGPYFVYMPLGDVSYRDSTELTRELFSGGISIDDHFTYPDRTLSKVGVSTVEVPFSERNRYIR
jgi:triacylglycerol lipase